MTSDASKFRHPDTGCQARHCRGRLLTALCALGIAVLPGLPVAQENAQEVETMRLTLNPSTATDKFFGSVSAREISSLSYGTRGCIVEVSEQAKRERVAQAGQVLVGLDDQRSRLALRTAEARILELEAAVEERALGVAAAHADDRRRQQELEFVGGEFERNSALLGRGLINEATMDTIERRVMDTTFAAERAKEAIANAEAAMKRAEIALEIGELDRQSAQVNLDMFVLAAPFDGHLVGFDANVGDCVQEGELAARIYMPDQKSVDVFLQISRLTAPQASGLSIGSVVRVSRVNGQVCNGTIARIDTEADLENQHLELTVDVERACAPDLFLNESVEIETMPGGDDNAFSVPNAAITGTNRVFLIDEETQSLVSVVAEVVSRGEQDTIVRIPNGNGRLLVTDSQATLVEGLAVVVRVPG